MHIAFNAWFWDAPNTGSGQYIRRLVTAMKKASPDNQYTLIMPPHNPQPDAVPDGVMVVSNGDKSGTSNLGKVIFEQRTFPAQAKAVGADIAHVPYWGSPLSCPIPVVTSVLDVVPLIYPAYAMGFGRRLYTELVSTSARGSNHIITLSESAAIDIESWLGIPEEKITAIYLAPDDRFHPQMGAEKDETVREKYNLPERFVLYLGGFDMRKRVDQALLAYTYVGEAEGNNIPLVLAGREPKWEQPLFPDMRHYASQLAIDDYVQWIGYVDEEDKPSLYRLADVFVYPSEYEGFGLPPLEAMASGTPVVTFDKDIFDEILEDGAYLVENVRGMAGAIIALLLQQPLRDTMINQGLAQATKYNWRKTAKETLTVYETVLRV